MSANGDPSHANYVPTSFEELKRASSTRRAPVNPQERPQPVDMASLAMNPDVMKQNKTAIFVALAIFLVAGGVIYFKPFLEAIEAFNTAGGAAATKVVTVAGQSRGTAGTLVQSLAHAKDVDTKAINIGLHGVACLNATLGGTKACSK